MLICAKDGWVDDWSEAIPENWNFKGCAKYQNIPIYCLLPDGRVEYAKPRFPNMNWLSKTFWRTVNVSREIEIEFYEAKAETFESFKACLIEAVKADDDVLTQFKEKQALIKRISGADSYSSLHAIYQENGWA
ncbi:hypothetical protein [Nitrogeniibacter aestuarii]|uniref:hypothetical protein n=1 Tax=Nitrogeniibacter aestuarii TaxID=2815343 RepID=UPI001D100D9A|nr:hypothetical protein [Nitrogeniibacter aestuarii]